jgi:hypothetical protein
MNPITIALLLFLEDRAARCDRVANALVRFALQLLPLLPADECRFAADRIFKAVAPAVRAAHPGLRTVAGGADGGAAAVSGPNAAAVARFLTNASNAQCVNVRCSLIESGADLLTLLAAPLAPVAPPAAPSRKRRRSSSATDVDDEDVTIKRPRLHQQVTFFDSEEQRERTGVVVDAGGADAEGAFGAGAAVTVQPYYDGEAQPPEDFVVPVVMVPLKCVRAFENLHMG